MADLLDSGLAWLAQKMRGHASAALAYQRGESSITVNGTWARVDREVSEGTDFRLQNELRDLLVPADEMTLGEPLVGDRVIEGSRTYEVLPLEGTQHWQWLGNRERMYRIHVKRIS